MKNRFNFYIVRSVAAVALLLLMPTMVQAQIVEYDEAREIEEAEMGVERVAKNFMKDYIAHASNNKDDRWVQIDLGSSQLIDGIKILLLTCVATYGDHIVIVILLEPLHDD